MTIAESLRELIVKERRQREASVQVLSSGSSLDPLEQIKRGAGQQAVEDLFFFTPPEDCMWHLARLRREIRGAFNPADDCLQAHYVRFLADVTLGLRSFLPRWNLQNAERHGAAALTDERIHAEADETCKLATELSVRAPAAATTLLGEWRAECAARLTA